MENFLEHVRLHVDSDAPHLKDLFETMAGEAAFARAWLDDDLCKLPANAQLLEVGGGVFLLACQLAQEGFQVTAIEPTGVGFGAFDELGRLALRLAERRGHLPTIVRCGVETFASDVQFDFAYSLNVMEHVASPEQAIVRVSGALAADGCYRFLCPNYLFPYEPHFNMLTAGSKSLTWALMRRRIEGSRRVSDPLGVWQSLNWITVPGVRAIVRTKAGHRATFRRDTLAWMLERAVSDQRFAQRRARWMVTLIGGLRRLGLLRLVSLIPATLQPIMDVRLSRPA